MRFLVTAGSTREMIDKVRDWGNIFTGNTGFSIAQAISELGEVDLLTSNRMHLDQIAQSPGLSGRMRGKAFTTHASLRKALGVAMATESYDAVFMSAAVSDYSPTRVYALLSRETTGQGEERWVVKDVQAGKVKSDHPAIVVLGEKTQKLVDLFRTQWGYQNLLVKFKLEVGIEKDRLIQIGQASRVGSGAEYLVANTLEMVQGDAPGAFLLSETGEEWIPRAELSTRMNRLIKQHFKI